jgi:hydroxymethylbilane synthase
MQVPLMSRVLTVATRAGALAIAQTQSIITALNKTHADLHIKIKEITAEGDKDRRTALWKLKTTGFFTSKLEDALLAHQADFAVHSFKDLPTQQRKELTVAAVCQRQCVEDCLLAAGSTTSIDQLQPSAKIGTSSPRRIALLRHIRPDLEPTDIRGNVTTRIRKLNEATFDAIILARAGIERLGLADNIASCFDPKEFIPAAAQGALAVQTRAADTETTELIAAIDDQKDRITCDAERRILSTMQCGCHAPAGAFAQIIEDDIIIRAFISDLQATNFIRREITGPVVDADKLAEELARELLDAGGKDILKSLER